MAFPTTSLIDDFNRASLGANWSADPFHDTGTVNGTIVSNQFAPSATGNCESWYNAATYGPNVEAYMTVAAFPADNRDVWIVAKLQQPSASAETADCYECNCTVRTSLATDTWSLLRGDNGVFTQLGATVTSAFAAGDKMGIECNGSTITAYKFASGAWSSVLSRTDATYQSATGYLSVGVFDGSGTTLRLDDFSGGTISSGTSLTVTPGTPNVAWTGTTPTLQRDAVRTPGTPNVAWTGSTPAVAVDKTLTPGTPTVAWSGSTPAVTTDKTLTPGAANVNWSGSTPAISGSSALTLTPGSGTVAWSGSTPSLVIQGDLTLTPGAGTIAWTGSTPTITATPDVVTPPVVETGGGGALFEDTSTEEVRNLRLTPGPAVVHWTGSRPTVRVDLPPIRVRLPERRPRVTPTPEVPAPPKVTNLTLRPGGARVAWSGSSARVTAIVPYSEVQRLQSRIAELEEQLEEETLVLAALSAG